MPDVKADRGRRGPTTRQLNRATLDRQLLLRRESVDVVEAVRRIVAIQAQAPESPYIGLWNRIAGFDPADLDKAFVDRAVVKATLMRGTMHAVYAEDWAAFHNAMLPRLRASRLEDGRFTSRGLSVEDANAFLPLLARFVARPRSGAEIEEHIRSRLGEDKERLWWAARTFAPLHHAPAGGTWTFRAPSSFINARTRLGPRSTARSTQRLLLRYLQAFGPASVQDFAQFTWLTLPVVRQALQALSGKVEELEGPDGTTLFDVPGAPIPAERSVAPPRLLPMWDSVLLAYADRSRVIPPDYRPLIIRRNGDVLPTLLVDGYVAGVWRPVEGGIEATAFHRLHDKAWKGLATEAGALVAFLADRDPTVYRRYAHWWTKGMPSAEVRVLPG